MVDLDDVQMEELDLTTPDYDFVQDAQESYKDH